MKNIYILLIAFLSFSLFPYSCEEEYIEGIGWKKIVYQDSGPVESLGRCPSSDTEATAVIVLGLLFWGAYEYFDAEPKALMETSNLQILPFDEIKINSKANTTINVKLFNYSF
jgi:hypothetical protein